MSERPTVRVAAGDLETLIRNVLVAAGASPENAEAAAEIHVEADRCGVGAQGADYLYYSVQSLERGLIDGKAEPRIVRETAATVLIDGRRGLGHRAALLATEKAVEKARAAGSATVALNNSTDIFMIGAYARRIADAGLVGMVMTSGPPLVHPHGGVEKVLSTNPIAFGIPRAGGAVLVFDMATSAIASSWVRQAAYYGEPLPPGLGVDEEGKPTTDPAAIRNGGAIAPLAGHKGFGLALSIGLLCGPLTGSGMGLDLSGWQGKGEGTAGQGHLFLAVDPAAFGAPDRFIAEVERQIAAIKTSKKAEGVLEILIPGERAAKAMREADADGVILLAETWERVRAIARRYKVAVPDLT